MFRFLRLKYLYIYIGYVLDKSQTNFIYIKISRWPPAHNGFCFCLALVFRPAPLELPQPLYKKKNKIKRFEKKRLKKKGWEKIKKIKRFCFLRNLTNFTLVIFLLINWQLEFVIFFFFFFFPPPFFFSSVYIFKKWGGEFKKKKKFTDHSYGDGWKHLVAINNLVGLGGGMGGGGAKMMVLLLSFSHLCGCWRPISILTLLTTYRAYKDDALSKDIPAY